MFNEANYITAINTALDNQEFYSINSIFSEYESLDQIKAAKLLGTALKTNLVLDNFLQQSQNFPDFWKQILRIFNLLSVSDQKIILNSITEISTWNYDVEKSILMITEKFCKQKSELEAIEVYNLVLHQVLSGSLYNFEVNNETLKCLWLIKQIELGKTIFDDYFKDVSFVFSKNTLKLFYKKIKKIEAKYIFLDFSSLVSSTPIGAIYSIIKSDKFLYNGSSRFPRYFYSSKIIQRIMINIHLKSGLESDQLTSLLESINPKFKFYGEEMNDFVLEITDPKFDSYKSGNYYLDGFGSSMFGDVHNLPFIEVNLESSENIDLLMKFLENNYEEIRLDLFNFKNKQGQDSEFISKINVHDAWLKYSQNINYLIEKMIESQKIRNEYQDTIVSLLVFGSENNYIDDKLSTLYLKKRFYFLKNRSFKYQDEKLLCSMLKFIPDNREHFIYKVLFRYINPMKLYMNGLASNDTKTSHLANHIELLNSDLGRYYSTIKVIRPKMLKEFRSEITDGIKSLKRPYSSYYIGHFLELFEKASLSVDKYTFIGYSHRYVGFSEDSTVSLLSSTICELISDNYLDEFVVRNMAIALAKYYSPDDLTSYISKVDYDFYNQLYIQIHILFCNVNILSDFNNISKWMLHLLNHFDLISTFCNQTIPHFIDISSERTFQLISILESSSPLQNRKIDDYTFNYIRNIDKFTVDHHENLFRLIVILVRKKLILRNHSFIMALEQILISLHEKDYQTLAHAYLDFFDDKIPYLDINRLKSIIGFVE